MTKALIADTDQILRNGLKFYLTVTMNIEVLEAENREQMVQILAQSVVDIIIMDSSILEGHRYEFIRELKAHFPNIPVLYLGPSSDPHLAVRTIKAGASGYVSLGSGTDELAEGINKVLDAKIYISQELAGNLVAHMQAQDGQKLPHELLSNREFQVFILIASGSTLREIADSLHLSIKTISTHRKNILQKMGLRNNSQLILYAIKFKLI